MEKKPIGNDKIGTNLSRAMIKSNNLPNSTIDTVIATMKHQNSQISAVDGGDNAMPTRENRENNEQQNFLHK